MELKIRRVLREMRRHIDRARDPNTGRRLKFDHPNEAVNDDLKAIFVAVPKTGTTSVRNQIRPEGFAMIDVPHLSIRQIRIAIEAFHLWRSLDGNAGFPNETVPTQEDAEAAARTSFDQAFKFASVRNPWARAVSLYSRREGIQVSDKMSFDAFIEAHCFASDTSARPSRFRNQLDWLTDAEGTMLVDYVYRLEDLDTAVDEIRARTDGRIVLERRERNVNTASKSKSYKDLYTDHTRKLIATRFEADIDTFKYTF